MVQLCEFGEEYKESLKSGGEVVVVGGVIEDLDLELNVVGWYYVGKDKFGGSSNFLFVVLF